MEEGDPYLEALGEAVRRRRRGVRMTQRDLAEATGIDQRNISDIERGRTDLRTRTQRRIAAALSTTSARLDDHAHDLLGTTPLGADALWDPRLDTADTDGDPYLEAVGEAIRERREELRMSQSALGDASALRQQEVSKIERGTIDLRARTLNRLAEALGRTAARIDDRALKLLGDRVRAAPGRETADSDTSDREHSLPLDGE